MPDYLQIRVKLNSLDRSRLKLVKSDFDFTSFNRGLVGDLYGFEVEKCRLARVRPPEEQAFNHALWNISASANREPEDEKLFEINRLLLPPKTKADFRTDPLTPYCENHQPVDPPQIPAALARFFEWIGSEGFGQLHALEQMVVTQLRLLEVAPFQHFSLSTASLYGYWTLTKLGYPWPSWQAGAARDFFNSLPPSFLFLTSELLQVLVDGYEASLECAGSAIG